MQLSKAIEQLKDLKINQESFVTQRDREIDPDNPFIKDMEAIDTVLDILENLKTLSVEDLYKKLQEINNP